MQEYTEEDLFDDGTDADNVTPEGGALAGELVDGEQIDPKPEPILAPEPAQTGEGEELSLTGVERFLSNYGVKGGLITYDDGESAHFSDLSPGEQEEVLSSLTSEAVPSVEEKYNLEQTEIDLLNAIREQDISPEEFVNNIVDYRLNYALNTKEAINEDFSNMPNDAMFMRHLVDTVEDITADEAAEELEKAKDMNTYPATVNSIREGYLAKQQALVSSQRSERDREFSRELEFQRADVVRDIEGINDIAGAPVTDNMKEFLLHDMMELNDANDPVLMEKIFSDPKNMFKANWFLTYGEDYISGLNDYWKKEVSKATKNSYYNATRDMPGKPMARGYINSGDNQANGSSGSGNINYGDVVSEEDLFNE